VESLEELSLVIRGNFLELSLVICHWSLVGKVSEGGKEGSWEDRKLGSWEEGKGRRQETEGEKDGRKELLIVNCQLSIVNEKRRGEGGIRRQWVSGQ
jgi:hypothetical protein